MEATLHDMKQKIVDFILIIKSKNEERDEFKKQLDNRTASLVYYNFFKYLSIFLIVFVLIVLMLLLVLISKQLIDHK